jgi:hypothetical protein
MTKFMEKSFSVNPIISQQYRDNYDAIFRKEPTMPANPGEVTHEMPKDIQDAVLTEQMVNHGRQLLRRVEDAVRCSGSLAAAAFNYCLSEVVDKSISRDLEAVLMYVDSLEKKIELLEGNLAEARDLGPTDFEAASLRSRLAESQDNLNTERMENLQFESRVARLLVDVLEKGV